MIVYLGLNGYDGFSLSSDKIRIYDRRYCNASWDLVPLRSVDTAKVFTHIRYCNWSFDILTALTCIVFPCHCCSSFHCINAWCTAKDGETRSSTYYIWLSCNEFSLHRFLWRSLELPVASSVWPLVLDYGVIRLSGKETTSNIISIFMVDAQDDKTVKDEVKEIPVA